MTVETKQYTGTDFNLAAQLAKSYYEQTGIVPFCFLDDSEVQVVVRNKNNKK